MSILIYWYDGAPKSHQMGQKELSEALKFSEALRKDSKNSHVCISTEFEDSVGRVGVSETDSSYYWKKRRTQ